MKNSVLMKKVIDLDTQTLTTREQSQRVMIQISIIRKAFGVKNAETDQPVMEYERKRVLSDEEIENEFHQYLRFWEWAVHCNNPDKAQAFSQQLHYFIDGVRFFDETLAETFTEMMMQRMNLHA